MVNAEKLLQVSRMTIVDGALRKLPDIIRRAKRSELRIISTIRLRLDQSDMTQAHIGEKFLCITRSQASRLLNTKAPDRSKATLLQAPIMAYALALSIDISGDDEGGIVAIDGLRGKGDDMHDEIYRKNRRDDCVDLRRLLDDAKRDVEALRQDKATLHDYISMLRTENNALKKAMAHQYSGDGCAM